MNKKRKNALRSFYGSLDRSLFMDMYKELAKGDFAVPIGYNQTISQPSLVLLMTELLELNETCNVLEIGTGSGYQTAFLAKFSRSVVTIECIEALHHRAKERLSEMDYKNITYVLGDGSKGWAVGGPYDRIIVTAAANEIPKELVDQLKPNGIMVIPVGNAWYQQLLKVIKKDDGEIDVIEIEMVQFVPLVGKYSIK